MEFNKIVLAGGSGYLGTVLANYYKTCAKQVIILSRSAAAPQGNVTTVVWDAKTLGSWVQAVEGADMLINLCGKSVNCRYTAKNKALIFKSRLVPTALLGEALAKLASPPALWINITSATIYRHAQDAPQDEFTGEIGTGFSVEVCKQWEKVFFDSQTPRTRKVALRMGIVLGAGSDVFPRLLALVKFGLGGRHGSGRQYVNWLHEQDAVSITRWLWQNTQITGAVNATAPNAVTNSTLMATIRQAYGISFGLNAPAWMLEIGAFVLRTETELMLKSRWVAPQILSQSGYTFKYPNLAGAVAQILNYKR